MFTVEKGWKTKKNSYTVCGIINEHDVKSLELTCRYLFLHTCDPEIRNFFTNVYVQRWMTYNVFAI